VAMRTSFIVQRRYVNLSMSLKDGDRSGPQIESASCWHLARTSGCDAMARRKLSSVDAVVSEPASICDEFG